MVRFTKAGFWLSRVHMLQRLDNPAAQSGAKNNQAAIYPGLAVVDPLQFRPDIGNASFQRAELAVHAGFKRNKFILPHHIIRQ